MYVTGQITTASAMTWMVKYLDENKDVQEKLRVSKLTQGEILCSMFGLYFQVFQVFMSF